MNKPPTRIGRKKIKYELICGIDFRYLDISFANKLKTLNFVKIRLAWDYGYKYQYAIHDAIRTLRLAGYKNKDIMIFILCNWKIPYSENLKKLDLLKVWGVKVADCYFDNQTAPNIIPLYWNDQQIKDFRAKCRKHNQLIAFDIDPEEKTLISL